MKVRFLMDDVFNTPLAQSVYEDKYRWDEAGEKTWGDTVDRVVSGVMSVDNSNKLHADISTLIEQRKFIPGGRQLYAAGRDFHQVNNCFLLTVGDDRKEWSWLTHRVHDCLLTGGGVGVEYSQIRPAGSELVRSGGIAAGPLALMQSINDMARHIVQGGQRRPALWAGLHWKHADIFEFIQMKDWSDEVKAAKARDFTFPATMDVTNVSVRLDKEFFVAFHDKQHPWHAHAKDVFLQATYYQCLNGEPGFTNDWDDQILRNA
jgi:ribonucleoside-diphosphate reductase alpha chain